MKRILLAVIVFASCHTAVAQKGFNIGLTGAFNSAWILNQNNYGTLSPFTNPIVRQSEMNYKPTWGWHLGLALGYNFTKNWGLHTQILYDVTGQKYEDNFEGPAVIPEGTFGSATERVNVKRQVSLSYIQIPLLVKFTTNKGQVAKFFVCLGPQIGFRLSATEKVSVAGYTYEYDSTANYSPSQKFKTFDIGLALQFGTDIYATDHLYFEIGFNSYGGLADINGKVLRTLDWYSKNDLTYQKSYNFRAGIMLGIHYIIGYGRDNG